MDQDKFALAEDTVEKIATFIDQKLESPDFKELSDAIDRLGKALAPRYGVALKIVLEITDEEREQTLPLLTTGYGVVNGLPPYRAWGDSARQRYLVNGEIQVVPQDYCPKCWEYWDLKFEYPECGSCGLTLGQDCKVLLDSDACPHCVEGHVSMQNPTCDRCGYHVNLAMVTWG